MSPFLPAVQPLPIVLERGEGCRVFDRGGRAYLDMYGGHAVTSTGHCHPAVVKAIQEQASKLIFYSNVLQIRIREDAARRLTEIAPLKHVFFVNSGAEANENAVKLATRITGRRKILAMTGGFHGRTLLTLNLTEPEKYRATASRTLDDIAFSPFGEPPEVDADTACVILEPVQSMAGVRTAPPEFFIETAKRCRENGALLIYDEIQTGMGRAGDWFYAGRHGVIPDMITLAKGVASGVPLGAVLAGTNVAEKVEHGWLGSTFGAGPLAMAALDATIRIIEEEKILENVRRRSAQIFEGLEGTAEVRGEGLLIGIRLNVPVKPILAKLRDEGVLAGGSDDPNVIRLMPPLTLSEEEADQFLRIFRKVVT